MAGPKSRMRPTLPSHAGRPDPSHRIVSPLCICRFVLAPVEAQRCVSGRPIVDRDTKCLQHTHSVIARRQTTDRYAVMDLAPV